jgi:hypothetical protein
MKEKRVNYWIQKLNYDIVLINNYPIIDNTAG